MNKLLISLLSLTGVAGLSTGGYFLLKGNSSENVEDSKPTAGGQKNGEVKGAGKATNGEAEDSGNSDEQAAAASK